MTREEAIEAIKCNWPDSRYTILREALDMAISALREQDVANKDVEKWISVKDRLPEPKKLVLCIYKDINGVHYGFSRYQYDNVWYVSNEGMPEVTHWMPMPEPPKEGTI